jgi:phosphoribosyl 1,2-cyclic phosphodiesterase
MKIQFQVFASGSNGNCAIISTPEGALLIDAGISRIRLLRFLEKINIKPNQIKGILISHAHTDHCGGLPVFSDIIKAPIISSKGTLEEFNRYAHLDRRWEMITKNAVAFDDASPLFYEFATIYPLPTKHDVNGCSAFRIKIDETNFSIITDTGELLPHQLKALKESTVALIEMNHDVQALYRSDRSKWLKRRVQHAHLSNEQTTKALNEIIDQKLKVLLFGHLSGECNSPKLVQNSLALWGKNNDEFPWNCFICRRDKSGVIIKISESENIQFSEQPLDLKKLIKNYTPPSDLTSYFP